MSKGFYEKKEAPTEFYDCIPLMGKQTCVYILPLKHFKFQHIMLGAQNCQRYLHN
jgi:hypothetical protein